MNLTQQLEDKKKGCGKLLGKGYNCGEPLTVESYYCPICQAEIAILEQAIAEMQNLKDIQDAREQEAYAKGFGEGFEKGKEDARQEILEDVEEILNEFINESNMDGRGICFNFHDTDLFELRDKLSKLNQPKTENSILIDTGMKPEDWIYNGEFEQLNQPKTEKENSKQ
jgi:hypothetical protein